jgi:hypothetical protein
MVDLDERRIFHDAPVLRDVEHIEVLREVRARCDAHELSELGRRFDLAVGQVRLAHFPPALREHRADGAARDDRLVLARHERIDIGRIPNDGERPARARACIGAVQARDPQRRVLGQYLDAVAAEGRGDALAVEQLALCRLRRQRSRGQGCESCDRDAQPHGRLNPAPSLEDHVVGHSDRLQKP